MNTEMKQKWVKALRSGKYMQLRNGFYDGKHHCCLAVLSATVNATPGDTYEFPDDEAMFGLTDRDRTRLIKMNDDGKSFEEIAAYIEANL